MDMDHTADFGLIGLGAVKAVIDRQEMFGGQFVGPFNEERLAACASQTSDQATRSRNTTGEWPEDRDAICTSTCRIGTRK